MYVLFDIGGTKTRVAVSRDLKTFTAEKFETPKRFEEGIERIGFAVERLAEGEPLKGAAGGIRGPLNKEKTTIVSETVLTDWVGKPIKKTLEARLGVPVNLENDAALGALGEANFGAGKGYDIVAYLTVSTGVGGARVVNGVLDEASTNFEPGHQIVDIDGSTEGGTKPDTLQGLISGSAFEHTREIKPYEVPQANPVWDQLAKYLAYGLKNTIVYWSPDVIVLGGSMILGDPRILLPDIVEHTDAVLAGEQPCPPIFDAALGDDVGLYGALALLRKQV